MADRTAPLPRPPGVPLRLPQHPGRFLHRQCLAPLRLSQTEAARRLGISRRRVNEIVQGHRGITPDTAIRCALAFGIAAEFWLGLQLQWDVYHGWQQLRRQALRGRRPSAGQTLLRPMPPAAVASTARAGASSFGVH